MRASLRQRYLKQLSRRPRVWTQDDLTAPAIVLAPHQDEETLGCGATIAAKRAAGAPVQIVFLTDGCALNGQPGHHEKLRQLRQQEARAAAEALGVPANCVTFLDYPDGDLLTHRAQAAQAVRELLAKHRPRQAFVPFRGDTTRDHVAASRIFYDAVDALDAPLDVFEYPLWFWSRWPWSPGPGARSWKKVLAHTRDAARSSWAVRFQLRAYMASPEAMDAKRRALAAHRQQTTRRLAPSDPNAGPFLQDFLAGFEVFHRKTL